MRYFFFIVLLTGLKAPAQIPRNGSGVFEYAHEVTIASGQALTEKARKFFNQPFLIHWDSVLVNGEQVTGMGYINVRAKSHGLGTGRNIPVSLQLDIAVSDKGYSYNFHRFAVNKSTVKYQFALEEKPDAVKPSTYDQLLRSTHDRVSFVIGYLKRYMEE
jgi:hypothetical protein